MPFPSILIARRSQISLNLPPSSWYPCSQHSYGSVPAVEGLLRQVQTLSLSLDGWCPTAKNKIDKTLGTTRGRGTSPPINYGCHSRTRASPPEKQWVVDVFRLPAQVAATPTAPGNTKGPLGSTGS